MKIHKIVKLLKTTAALAVFTIMLASCKHSYAYNSQDLYDADWVNGDKNKGGETISLDLNSLENVHVSYTSGTFRLLPTDGEPYVNYAITSRGKNDEGARIEVLEGTKECKIIFKNSGLLEGDCEYYIDLYVPKDAIKTLKVEMQNGNAYMHGINCDKLTAGTQSGDMVMDQVDTKKAILGATSGNIVYNGSAPSMVVDVTSGNIKAETDKMPKSLICDITSGYVNLVFPDSEDGYKLIFTRTSGYIKSDFGREKFWTLLLKNGFTTYGDKKGLYYVDITSGKLEMNKSE